MFILFILNFLLYILIIPCGALIREPHMFWFQQWTVLPLGKHKPPRAVAGVIATVAVMVQISQRIVTAIVEVVTTSQPETTGFLVFRHDLVVVGKVAPTTNLSVAGGFQGMLGIIGIPVVPQLLGVVAHSIPCPLQGFARSNHLLDEHRQEGDVLGLGTQPALPLVAVLLGVLVPPVVALAHGRLHASLIADPPITVEGRVKGRTVEVLHASLDDLLHCLHKCLFGRSLGAVLQEVIVEAQLRRGNQLEDTLLMVAGSVLSSCLLKREHTATIGHHICIDHPTAGNHDLQFVVSKHFSTSIKIQLYFLNFESLQTLGLLLFYHILCNFANSNIL